MDFLNESIFNNMGLVSTKHISDITGVKHKNIIELVEKYKSDILFLVPNIDDIKKNKIKTDKYGTSKSYLLTDSQAKFVLMLLSNVNHIIVNYKKSIIENNFDDKILHYSSRGFVYILRNEEGLYKIGRTYSIKKRIRAIITQSGYKNIKIIAISDFIFEYNKLEKELHRLYKNKLYIGEWYKLNNEELEDCLFHIENNGSTIIKKNNSYALNLNYYIDYNIAKNLFIELDG